MTGPRPVPHQTAAARPGKVQVAVATIVVTYAAQAGFVLNEETVITVLGVGVALIVGIAHEDAGRSGSSTRRP